MRVLIIEDDISKALAFEIILNKLDVNDIVTVDEWNKAEEIMNLKRPDFVIADLHLFGVSILNKLCYFEENGIPFIICTAYPSETIMDSALKSNAANVIVIPAHKDILTYNFKRMIQIASPEKANGKFAVIKVGRNMHRVLRSSINLLEVNGNYVSIHITGEKKIILKKSLIKAMSELDMNELVRINKTQAVNLSRIQTLKSNDLHLDNGNVLKVSFNYRENLVNLLRNSSTSH